MSDELKLQKNLTYAGSALLASSLFIGPLGLFGAVGIFSGKILRNILNKTAREKYNSQQNELSREREQRTMNVYEETDDWYANILTNAQNYVSNIYDFLDRRIQNRYENLRQERENRDLEFSVPVGRRTLEFRLRE